MIDFETATSIVLNAAKPLPGEWVALDAALGRFLASDIVARAPQPRFDASAVDGYAVRVSDVRKADLASPVRLELAGTVRAGDAIVPRVKGGTAVQVLTGGMTPEGSVGVVMQEFTKAVRVGGLGGVHFGAQLVGTVLGVSIALAGGFVEEELFSCHIVGSE